MRRCPQTLAAAALSLLASLGALANANAPDFTPSRSIPPGALAGADATDPALGDAQRLLQQRAVFRRAWEAARRGERGPLDAHRDLLADYLLYPDLEAAWLGAEPARRDDGAIEAFIAAHSELRPARRLRLRWLRALAGKKRWDKFLEVYAATPARSADVVLACQALHARIELSGNAPSPELASHIAAEGTRLWMVGISQPDECDPVFDYLHEAGHLDEQAHHRRIALALDEGEIGLAGYLARHAAAEDRARVDRFKRMRSNPDRQLRDPALVARADADPDWLYYGFDRLAYREPARAQAHWDRLRPQLRIPDATAFAIDKRIALSFARDLEPDAARHLDRVGFDDPELAAWRLRTALRDQDWYAALAAHEKLPPDERQRDLWRYWQGRALLQIGESSLARELLTTLAGERSYHGFLAADHLDTDYAFNAAAPQVDEARVQALSQQTGFRRAREFLSVGLTVEARSEWNAAVAALPAGEHAEVAVLAHRWDWHDSAIRAATRARMWDALEIRFPLPHRETFEHYASANGIDTAYAMGIARSESLFMPDAVSRAGALGLMQIMPRTGRGLARDAGIPYRGRETLFEPVPAIALGTRHLDEVLRRFDGNVVLATAAYNAGAKRVQQWLPAREALPADAWVDSVPFQETRRYVRRVLMAQAIFDYRLSAPPRRISTQMSSIPTPEELHRRAAAAATGRGPGTR